MIEEESGRIENFVSDESVFANSAYTASFQMTQPSVRPGYPAVVTVSFDVWNTPHFADPTISRPISHGWHTSTLSSGPLRC